MRKSFRFIERLIASELDTALVIIVGSHEGCIPLLLHPGHHRRERVKRAHQRNMVGGGLKVKNVCMRQQPQRAEYTTSI